MRFDYGEYGRAPFFILTFIFYVVLKASSRHFNPQGEALPSSTLDLSLEDDTEHRRAIEEFDRQLQGQKDLEPVPHSKPLRHPKEIEDHFVTGWVRYLSKVTYHNELKWEYHFTGSPNYSHLKRTTYNTTACLDGSTYLILYQRGAYSNGKTEHLIEIEFESGKTIKQYCPEDLGKELNLLVEASAKDQVSPVEMLEVLETLKEYV